MAWSAKKISFAAGAVALIAEAGVNNSLIVGLVYTGASAVTAPVLVHGVEVAAKASDARLAADRANYAERQRGGMARSEPGDADQPARQSDETAEDSPDMPRRLGPMLVARRALLARAASDPGDAASVRPVLDRMLADDTRALRSFERRATVEPVWAAVHRRDLAELRAMDAHLRALRDGIAASR